MRDGSKSSRESHDTGLGITFFDACFGNFASATRDLPIRFPIKVNPIPA